MKKKMKIIITFENDEGGSRYVRMLEVPESRALLCETMMMECFDRNLSGINQEYKD